MNTLGSTEKKLIKKIEVIYYWRHLLDILKVTI